MAYFVDFISFDFHPDSKRSMLCTFREPEIQSDFFLNRDLGLMILPRLYWTDHIVLSS